MLERILIQLLPIIISQASPEIIRAMKAMLMEMRKQAKKTANPTDDILAELIGAFVAEIGRE